MPRHAARLRSDATRKRILVVAGFVLLVAAATTILVLTVGNESPTRPNAAGRNGSSTTSSTSTSTTTTSTTTSTTVPLPPPGPGFVAGHVTAVGDSVMIDYQTPLEADIPGIGVQDAVSRQWGTGEMLLQDDKTSGQLGSEVIVALGTNGPIATQDFDAMMGILQGASRVVFVNIHVDRPWQDPNNAVLAAGATRYHNVVIADWASLADQHPEWFGPDGTHLAIDGTGAKALASLISAALSNG